MNTNITLYFIEGISEIDTPCFWQDAYDDITMGYNWNTFLDNYKVLDISTGFYPPHYKNTIKFNIDNYQQDYLHVNYLSIWYNDKYYFYFIDKLRYISPTIVEVDIHMDTIATYTYDNTLKLRSMHVNRMHIQRLNEVLSATEVSINRDYIRENFTKYDKKEILDTIYYKNDTRDWDYYGVDPNDDTIFTLVIKTSGNLPNTTCNSLKERSTSVDKNYDTIYSGIKYVNGENELICTSSLGTYIFPINREMLKFLSGNPVYSEGVDYMNYVIGRYVNGTEYVQIPCHLSASIRNILALPTNVAKAFILPLNIFYEHIYAQYDSQSGTSDIHLISRIPTSLDEIRECSINSFYAYFGYSGYNFTYKDACLFKPYNVILKPFTDNMVMQVSYSNYKYGSDNFTEWSYEYEPSIIDENYYEVSFGNSHYRSIAPLYQGLTNYFEYTYLPSIEDGTILFRCKPLHTIFNNDSGDVIFGNDFLNCSVVDDTIYTVDLTNEEYTKLKQYQTAAYASTALSGIMSVMGILGTGIAAAALGPVGGVSTAGLTKMGIYGIGAAASSTLGTIGNITGQSIKNNVDLEYAGNPVQSFGNFSSAITSEAIQMYLKQAHVPDIENVARTYYLYGNKVEKYVYNIKDCISRVFFNYIESDNIDFQIEYYFNDREIIDDIKRRFANGIRFWMINYKTNKLLLDIGNYKYDNTDKINVSYK